MARCWHERVVREDEDIDLPNTPHKARKVRGILASLWHVQWNHFDMKTQKPLMWHWDLNRGRLELTPWALSYYDHHLEALRNSSQEIQDAYRRGEGKERVLVFRNLKGPKKTQEPRGMGEGLTTVSCWWDVPDGGVDLEPVYATRGGSAPLSLEYQTALEKEGFVFNKEAQEEVRRAAAPATKKRNRNQAFSREPNDNSAPTTGDRSLRRPIIDLNGEDSDSVESMNSADSSLHNDTTPSKAARRPKGNNKIEAPKMASKEEMAETRNTTVEQQRNKIDLNHSEVMFHRLQYAAQADAAVQQPTRNRPRLRFD
ncbi:hypothetical protein BU26DRAFT_567975 [Trematosphaeria pertusa]|uniref:Uncharacterized protein n=1 Tax=Trematosphaeria pertusa TaxID=390896 RepID=A0A6A6I4Z1_9PLEO|nr:uncharacterized protein BU26DRAFT_567975 [Trematosphaeria pertusa]KAF2245386.1 hypothetical protein BU26DRAFT_567975 [Trematosphaeria pertusa]